MKPDGPQPTLRAPQEDRSARAFVWSSWLVMVVSLVVALILYGRNVPLTEGWQLVPALTGNEPDLLHSLWAQNNEHRIPFPKLVLLVLLWLSGGDFRAGMVFNIVLLAVASAALVGAARSIRGGRTIFADAVFPLGLLHLGHWNNVYWGWQVTQVLPTMLVVALLYRIIRDPGFENGWGSVSWGAGSLVLLPLCGANGLLFAPFFSAWVSYCAIRHQRGDGLASADARVGVTLMGSALVAVALTGVYFVGYVRPDWVPPNPGIGPSLVAAVQFSALGIGPVARSSWVLSAGFAMLVLTSSLALTVWAVTHVRGPERHRAVGMAVFVASYVAFVGAMGWGRAGVIAVDQTWPGRYALFAFPALVGAYFLWELYGGARGRTLVQTVLFAGALFMVPLNTMHGIWFRDWYLAGADAVLSELGQGTTAAELSERHLGWLDHAAPRAVLEERMGMLSRAGMGAWPQLQPGMIDDDGPPGDLLAEVQVRYVPEDGSEVVVVWGLDGWSPLSEGALPAGTVIVDGLMNTTMARSAGVFRATIMAPQGSIVDYGFLTTRDERGGEVQKWEGDYAAVAEAGAILAGPAEEPHLDEPLLRTSQTLVTREFRYWAGRAGEVFLVWGIDGWRAVPEASDPGRTVIEGGLMRTRMDREGEVFSAAVHVPEGSRMDYGFLTTDGRGVLDVVEQRWDWSETFPTLFTDGGVIEIEASTPLPSAWAEARDRWRSWLTVILVTLATWGLTFFTLRLSERPH